MKDVGARIRDCRLAVGMTQEDVAKHLGLGKQAVYKYEIGAVTNIPLENIFEMSLLFNVNPCYLAGWDEKKEVTAFSPTEITFQSPDEQELLTLYRGADDRAREDAIDTLRKHQKQDTAVKAI